MKFWNIGRSTFDYSKFCSMETQNSPTDPLSTSKIRLYLNAKTTVTFLFGIKFLKYLFSGTIFLGIFFPGIIFRRDNFSADFLSNLFFLFSFKRISKSTQILSIFFNVCTALNVFIYDFSAIYVFTVSRPWNFDERKFQKKK